MPPRLFLQYGHHCTTALPPKHAPPPPISASSGTLPSSFPMTGTDTKCFVSTYGPSSLLVEMTQLKGWLGLQNIGRPPPHVGLKKA